MPEEDYSNIRPEDILIITEEPVSQLGQPTAGSESEHEEPKEEDPLIATKYVAYTPTAVVTEEHKDPVMHTQPVPVTSGGAADPTDIKGSQ